MEPPYEKSTKEPPPAKVPAIEVFLQRVERDLFEKPGFKNAKDNLSPEERTVLKEFRAMPTEERNLVIRQQDKGNNFVFLNNDLDQQKVKEQMDKGFFEIVDEDPTLDTIKEINNWIDKWKPHGLSDKWVRYITRSHGKSHPGVNYPLIKTHKAGNPARIITSGCGEFVLLCGKVL